MQISELSGRSGVPIPTIKYYLREGLLPPGLATAATRAQYGEPHLRRLRLIRALLEIGELPVASIRRIVSGLDDETVGLHELLGRVQYALSPQVTPPADDPDWQDADAQIAALVADLGWVVTPESPARALLAGALVALHRLDSAPKGPTLREYAVEVSRVAALEVASVGGLPPEPPPGETVSMADRTTVVESAVAGMVLYERVLIALRRMAQEDASAARFGGAG
jgi:DNA-binding transcriptional MerR regulator